jgi:hypothetical protein
MMVVNGWQLIAHPLFLDQFEKLGAAVARLREKDPRGWRKSANAKLLAALRQLVFEAIPQDPTRPEYRQGGTLGDDRKHWFRAKFGGGRFRLFFRYSTSAKVIVFAWVAEAGQDADAAEVALHRPGTQAAPDFAHLRSPETYLGYRQASGFGGREAVRRDASQTYRAVVPGLNAWSLDGRWTVGGEHADLDKAGGGIVMRFHARDLHLVLGAPEGKPLRFQVTIDGHPPSDDHGADTDAQGFGAIDGQRLYQLVRQSGEVGTRLFEIRFLDAGPQVYALTFG